MRESLRSVSVQSDTATEEWRHNDVMACQGASDTDGTCNVAEDEDATTKPFMNESSIWKM